MSEDPGPAAARCVDLSISILNESGLPLDRRARQEAYHIVGKVLLLVVLAPTALQRLFGGAGAPDQSEYS